MWREVENGTSARPSDVDENLSKVYVYVRRNIVFVEEVTNEDGTAIPAHYKWEETQIPQDVWSICSKVLGHDSALDDVYAALAELATTITEEV